MIIFEITTISDEVVQACARLIPQLKLDFTAPSAGELQAVIDSDNSRLLAVRYPSENGKIVGILTLIVYRVPTGVRARVEDVVVEETMRGQGFGEALVRYALTIASEAGADGVALTSNPKREAANRLYARLGFKPWDTNLYYYKF